MARSKVFIASSSEGLEVTKTVRRLLLQELGPEAEVEPWTRAFELSATYIESLEKTVEESDFAILVLTPDDVTTSRKKEKLAPRDNVVFELGMFMGRLGRERCYLIQEERPDLKLPTDLLGVKTAAFKRPDDGDWKAALDPACAVIGERILVLGTRFRLSSDALAHMQATRDFSQRISGAWWSRIVAQGNVSLGFLEIELDEVSRSVRLAGRSYSADGDPEARWNSLLTSVTKDEREIRYYWEGWHVNTPKERFHGFGELEFEGAAVSGKGVTRGAGKFWDIDEAHPDRTVVKPLELHRLSGKGDFETMSTGREQDVRALIVKTLRDW